MDITAVARGTYYAAATFGILEWKTSRWENFSQLDKGFGAIAATDANDILAVGLESSGLQIYHWNGTDWYPIRLATGLLPVRMAGYGIWMNENEAFVIANGSDDNGRGASYVLHGK